MTKKELIKYIEKIGFTKNDERYYFKYNDIQYVIQFTLISFYLYRYNNNGSSNVEAFLQLPKKNYINNEYDIIYNVIRNFFIHIHRDIIIDGIL